MRFASAAIPQGRGLHTAILDLRGEYILIFHVLCGHFLTYTTKESKRKNTASETNQLSDRRRRRRRGRRRGWWEVFLNKEARRV